MKILGFLLLQFKSERKTANIKYNPSVSIVVPMYNEEKVVIDTVKSLLQIHYPKYEIIIVDDGSSDNSLKVCREEFKENYKITILSQSNQGKAAALNNGISKSQSEIIVCIDADTLVDEGILTNLLCKFVDTEVAAVAGNIKVSNLNNFITNVQNLEYVCGPNFEREVFGIENGVMVIPGAIGAYRKVVLEEIGGFSNDTLTEDTEITSKILYAGYKIKNAKNALGFTEAPSNWRDFCKQRIRWKIGTIQVLLKYHYKTPKLKRNFLTNVIIPYTWIYGILLPVLMPLADYLAIFLFYGWRNHELLLYLIFILSDSIIVAYILKSKVKEQVNFPKLILQRIYLRQLMFATYLKITFQLVVGKKWKWNKVERYGNNKIPV